MEKIVKIDGRPVKFKSTGASLLRYKAQSGKDPVYDFLGLLSALKVKNGVFILEDVFHEIGIEPLYLIAWAFAKTADDSIPPPLEWLDSFDEFPIFDIASEISELILHSFNRHVSRKKK